MKTAYELDDADIRAIALDCGFKLKPQPDGLEDLNPYVYKFARELLSTIPRPEDVAALRERLTPPAQADGVNACTSNPVVAHETGNVNDKQDSEVGILYVSLFRGHLENTHFDYYGDLPEGSYSLYTRPDNSALRKTAEEVLRWIVQPEFVTQQSRLQIAKTLRAALEKS